MLVILQISKLQCDELAVLYRPLRTHLGRRGAPGAGHEVLILKQHIAKNSHDADVIAKAQEIDAILVSLNGDFSDIVTYPPAKFQGIIALQVRNHPEAIPSILRRLTNYLAANPDQQH